MSKLIIHLSRRLILFAIALSSFICAFCAKAIPQTVRSKAEERFSAFGWAEKQEEDAASGSARSARRFELAASAPEGESPLSPDSGAFPAAPLAALMPSRPVPPILPGAGSLDFSRVPQELIELFESIALSLKSRDYSGIKAASASPFIPVMLGHMMRRLPEVSDAAFAGVEVAADGRSARATLRLNLAGGSSPVLASAEAVLEEGEWRAADVIFDGDSYEQAAKPSGM